MKKKKQIKEPDYIDSRQLSDADLKKVEQLIQVHKKKQKKSGKRAA